MGKTFQVARIAGVPVAIDAGLAVLAALFWLVLSFQVLPVASPDTPFVQIGLVAAATVVAFLMSILAHELGHAAVAKRNDITVLGINLNVFGGYAKLDRQAPTPRSEFSIAAAGPAVNLFLGGLFIAVALAVRFANISLLTGAVAWLAGMNIVLAVLNLFPAAPLDGGRILTAALWRRTGDPDRARIFSGRVGLVVGIAIFIVGVAALFARRNNALPLIIVGVFLLMGARSEIGTATIRRRLKTIPIGQVMAPVHPAVADSTTLDQLLILTQGRHDEAVPVSRWGTQTIGYVLPASALAIAPAERSWTPVTNLMQPEPTVARSWTTETVDNVLDRQPKETPLFSVVHDPTTGHVVGTITEAQLAAPFLAPTTWGRPKTEKPKDPPPPGPRLGEQRTAPAG